MAVPFVSHVEWLVTDLDRSVAFFSALFSWTFEVYSTHYRVYMPKQGSGVVVGLMEVAEVKPSNSPMVHIQVDAIAAYLQRATELGAEISTPRTEVPGHGWYAQLLDPDGNIIGLFEAAVVTRSPHSP